MSSLTAYDAFKARLDAFTVLPVRFENENFQDLIDANTSAFVYVEVYGDTYNQDTMGAPGANVWEERGVTYLHVMVPSQTGTRAARAYANQLLYLFREQPIGGLFMPEMSIGAGEPGKDFPNYYSIAATIFWSRRDITTIP
ncbi:phage tail terminator-like protein [Corticibacterium sp. UT-5YL-CI-8]|nr:phage tail terminator-like protein [Tianweitania sp. UT-5YL-CI-8]